MAEDSHIHLSVIIPAYNEESNLPGTLRDVADYLKAQSYRAEVIVVDDGSTDRTREVAGSCRDAFAALRVLGDPVNRGKGYAVKVGVAAAVGDYVLFMDADNSTRLREVPKLLAAVQGGPRNNTFSLLSMNRRLDSSSSFFLLIEG